MYLRLELIYQHYLTNMKDQHNHKITEHEFIKDIGHRTEGTLELVKNNSNPLELRELFEKLEKLNRDYPNDQDGFLWADKKNLRESITKQIQSDLLKDILKMEIIVGDQFESYCAIDVDDIKKLAEEKEIILN